MDNLDKLIQLIRKQRHDAMNDIQVIYGYLQVQKLECALEYIKKLRMENEIISELYSLGDDYLAFCMENNIRRLMRSDFSIELNLEIDRFYNNVFNKDYIKKCDLVNNIFNKFENNSIQHVYIYIFEDDLGENLLICNKESVIDELSWMESWQKIDINIDNTSLYECCYGNNIGYRINFKLIQ
jgi:hypothetical protein